MNFNQFVKFRREGNFYSVYNDDAYVIAYIMKYKLVYVDKKNIKAGFPLHLLNEVIYYLDRNKISYIVLDEPKLFKDFKENNNYLHFAKKDQFINSLRYPYQSKKVYSGEFTILFDGDDEVEKYVIGENINSDAEIVEKAFNNDIEKMIELNSGVKFKIIFKNIK